MTVAVPLEQAPQRVVLVVDPDPAARGVLRRILNAAGYRVGEAEDAEAALGRARAEPPDAFVVDVGVPTEGGVELCHRLREIPRFRVSPILVVTSSEDRALMRRAFAAGCDDFTRKPLEPMVVTARLRSLLAKHDYFRQLERVRENLARYVSPRVRQIVESRIEDSSRLRPEEREVCILFSDIRDFTALSQKIPPAALFAAVSQHLGAQVDAVYRHHGYVDKFGGDGIMAVFDGPEMVHDACRCALKIMQAAGELPPVAEGVRVPLGVGIHTGPVVVGNIGTGEHLDYSVIGNSVNLAARLCGYARSMDIIVSEAVRCAAGDSSEFVFASPQSTRIRGVREPMTLYRLRPCGAED